MKLQGKEIKKADSFTYLGSVVSKDGGTDEDIKEQTTTHLERRGNEASGKRN